MHGLSGAPVNAAGDATTADATCSAVSGADSPANAAANTSCTKLDASNNLSQTPRTTQNHFEHSGVFD